MTEYWEYKVLTSKTDVGFLSGTDFDTAAFEAVLNRLGGDAWELVSVFAIEKGGGGSKYVNAVLKRMRYSERSASDS